MDMSNSASETATNKIAYSELDPDRLKSLAVGEHLDIAYPDPHKSTTRVGITRRDDGNYTLSIDYAYGHLLKQALNEHLEKKQLNTDMQNAALPVVQETLEYLSSLSVNKRLTHTAPLVMDNAKTAIGKTVDMKKHRQHPVDLAVCKLFPNVPAVTGF